MNSIDRAIEKLTDEYAKITNPDRYITATKSAVFEAVCDLCNKSEAFAAIVAEHKKTFTDCMKEITRKIQGSISDIDLFRRAVQFYVPAADLRFDLTITLPDEAPKANSAASEIISIFDIL